MSTNPYYTVDGAPVAASRGQSAAMRGEFVLIQSGFDGVNTQFNTLSLSIAAKGAITGQVWTGTHDFTGATITAPTQTAGDSSTKVATTAFVAATAFASALPAISAGTADFFATNNGTVGSWGKLLKDGTIRFANSADTTKLVAFDASAIGAGTTRTYAWPNKNGTVAMTSDLVLTVAFLSADQTITAAGALTIAHSLGSIPKIVMGYLKCVTGELGYTAGDVVCMPVGQDGSATSIGVSVVPDATNLNVRYGSNANTFSILNKGTGVGGNITNANWTFHMRAFA